MQVERISITDRESWLAIARKFASSVIPEPNSGCWLWTEGADDRGYGVVWTGLQPRQMKAPRVSWLLSRGDFDRHLFVCHRCDTPACVNPDHLFLGSHRDNMLDRHAKGRSARCGASGSANGTKTRPDATHRGSQIVGSKLNEASVRVIRADRRRLRIIADEYGVSEAAISMLKNRITWRHVD